MKKLMEYLNLYGPLVAVLVPSLIVGLTNMPGANKDGHWTKKVIDILKVVLQVFSFLSHRDAPGTLKPPIKVDKADGQSSNDNSGGATTAVVLIFSLLLSGCCKPGVEPGFWCKAGTATKDCALELAKKEAPGLLEDVLLILTQGSGNWLTLLIGLEHKLGIPFVVCLVQKSLSQLSARNSHPDPAIRSMGAKGTARAHIYLKQKGVK